MVLRSLVANPFGVQSSSKADSTRTQASSQCQQQKDIGAMKGQITALEQAVKQESKEATSLRKEVHIELKQVRQEVTEVKETFQQTLTSALSQTQEVLQRGFKEDFETIRALLSGASRKRSERDEDMQG